MEAIIERAKRIKCLICDLDGILTSGQVYYGPEGECIKKFNVQDGLGLKLLMKSGVEVAIITAADTPIVSIRALSLNIKHLYQGQLNKTVAYQDLLTKLNITDEVVAYIGDDWPDLPLIRKAHLGITVSNGIEALKKEAQWVTKRAGGKGAIREVCDLLLTAQGSYEKLLSDYGL